jgi:hypothetical protein
MKLYFVLRIEVGKMHNIRIVTHRTNTGVEVLLLPVYKYPLNCIDIF